MNAAEAAVSVSDATTVMERIIDSSRAVVSALSSIWRARFWSGVASSNLPFSSSTSAC